MAQAVPQLKLSFCTQRPAKSSITFLSEVSFFFYHQDIFMAYSWTFLSSFVSILACRKNGCLLDFRVLVFRLQLQLEFEALWPTPQKWEWAFFCYVTLNRLSLIHNIFKAKWYGVAVDRRRYNCEIARSSFYFTYSSSSYSGSTHIVYVIPLVVGKIIEKIFYFPFSWLHYYRTWNGVIVILLRLE